MSTPAPRYDVYVGCHGDLTGWGGAMIAGRGLATACMRAGLPTALFGMGAGQPKPAVTTDGIPLCNVPVNPRPLLWRVHTWCIPRILARHLRTHAPPRLAFVSFSPFWTVAARRAWPDGRVLFRYQGLLSNCLPFTRSPNERPGFWERISRRGTHAVERGALQTADLILAPAREHADEIVAFEPVARRRVHVCLEDCRRYDIPSALRQHTRTTLGLSDAEFLILLVGSCDRNKAFDHALRELTLVEPRAHLAIVGDGPQRPELCKLAATLGLTERVHFVGVQTDMAPWYAVADCAISTSHYDTFPNVIREALACGRPVLVPVHDPPRTYAGIAGLIAREGSGLLYDRLTPGALADCLNRLARDREQAARLGACGRAVAERLFRWDETINVLRSATANVPAAPTPSAPAPAAAP